jgi:hypothetical protein
LWRELYWIGSIVITDSAQYAIREEPGVFFANMYRGSISGWRYGLSHWYYPENRFITEARMGGLN